MSKIDGASDWMRVLEPRELAQVYHAIAYEKDFKQAGVPGHNHLLLIAKLAKLLDEVERKYIDLGTT